MWFHVTIVSGLMTRFVMPQNLREYVVLIIQWTRSLDTLFQGPEHSWLSVRVFMLVCLDVLVGETILCKMAVRMLIPRVQMARMAVVLLMVGVFALAVVLLIVRILPFHMMGILALHVVRALLLMMAVFVLPIVMLLRPRPDVVADHNRLGLLEAVLLEAEDLVRRLRLQYRLSQQLSLVALVASAGRTNDEVSKEDEMSLLLGVLDTVPDEMTFSEMIE